MIRFKIRATQLEKIDLTAMIKMDRLGNIAFDQMKKRVLSKHLSEDGKPLPPYKVKEAKTRGRYRNVPWAQRKTPSTEKSKMPADIWQQLRQLGGVNKPLTNEAKYKGGTPIYYSNRTPDRALRGKVWGYHWSSREEYLRDNLGGPQVDHMVSGSMWASRRIKASAKGRATPSVTVGFKGGNPKGSVFDLRKSGKKLNAATKALLANSRSPDGTLTMTNPQEWLGIAESEMQVIVDEFAKFIKDGLDAVPVTVVVT